MQAAPQPTQAAQPQMAQPAQKGTNKALVMVLACLGGCLIVVFVAFAVFGFAAKKAMETGGKSLFEKGIEQGLEKSLEQQFGENVDLNLGDGKVDIKTKEGSFSTSGELPVGFPTDIPIYSGATVVSSVKSNKTQDAGESYFVILSSKDKFDSVKAFYVSQLPAKGWSEESSLSCSTGGNKCYQMSSVKGGRTLSVTLSEEDKMTTISIMAGTQAL